MKSNREWESGRGRLTLVFVLLVLAAAAVAGWRFVHPEPAPLAVNLSETAAQSGRSKVDAMALAEMQATRTGRPVPVSQTFTDSEISSLANEQARAQRLPVEHVLLHATSRGIIQGQATAYAGGQQVPVSFDAVPEASEANIRVRVTRVNVAALPLPGPVADQLTGQLQQLLSVPRSTVPLNQLQVITSEGRVTVTGVAQPS